jgi:hypothetical protein
MFELKRPCETSYSAAAQAIIDPDDRLDAQIVAVFNLFDDVLKSFCHHDPCMFWTDGCEPF